MKDWWQRLSKSERRTVRIASIALCLFLLFYGGLDLQERMGQQQMAYQQASERLADLNIQVLKRTGEAQKLRFLGEKWHLHKQALKNDSQAVSHLREAIAKLAAELKITTKHPRVISGGRQYAAILKMDLRSTLENSLIFMHQLKQLGFPISLDRLVMQAIPKSPGQVHLQFDLELHRMPKGVPHV